MNRQYPRILTVSLTVFLISPLCAQTSTPAVSPIENRVDALENKVDKMDGNISQILDLLKNKPAPSPALQSVPTTPATGSAPAAPSPAGTSVPQIAKADAQSQKLQPGALLDVWLLEPGNNAIPTTPSMGTLLDEKEYFSPARYLDEPTLKGSEGRPLGFLWSGFLKVKEKGQHVFVLELAHGKEKSAPRGYNNAKITLAAELQIEDNPVVTGSYLFNNAGEQAVTTPFSAVAELESGLYKVKLWVTARATDYEEKESLSILHKNLSVAVKLRSPGSRVAVPLSSADIFHKE